MPNGILAVSVFLVLGAAAEIIRVILRKRPQMPDVLRITIVTILRAAAVMSLTMLAYYEQKPATFLIASVCLVIVVVVLAPITLVQEKTMDAATAALRNRLAQSLKSTDMPPGPTDKS